MVRKLDQAGDGAEHRDGEGSLEELCVSEEESTRKGSRSAEAFSAPRRRDTDARGLRQGCSCVLRQMRRSVWLKQVVQRLGIK